jgi:hypothetical protein
MLICVECKKEMICLENGFGARYGESHVYPGDRYVCPKCYNEVITTNKEAVHDPEKKIPSLQMRDEG